MNFASTEIIHTAKKGKAEIIGHEQEISIYRSISRRVRAADRSCGYGSGACQNDGNDGQCDQFIHLTQDTEISQSREDRGGGDQ